MRVGTLTAGLLPLLAAAAQRPNIIWLQADSVDGRLLDPQSPYYYKIKASGLHNSFVDVATVFNRHYTNSPQCVPSRTGMMVGRYVSDTKTTNNGQGIARSTKTGRLDSSCVAEWNETQCTAFAAEQNVSATLLDMVASAGYSLQLFGRFDVGAGIIDDYGGTTSGDGFHGGPATVILARGAGVNGESDTEPWSSTTSNASDPYEHDSRVTDDVIAWLEANAAGNRTEAEPFFLWMGLLDPHPPYDTNATWLAHLNASNIDAPPEVCLPPWEGMHPYDRDMSYFKAATLNYTDAQLKTMRSAYWGACAEAFNDVARVIDTAQRTGHLNNTVVFFTSDHGEMSMEHRQDYKNSQREPATRVPLVVAAYGAASTMYPYQGVVSNLSSHVDIVPTIAELVGAAPLDGVRGSSLVPFMTSGPGSATSTPAPPRKDYIVSEYHSNLANTGSFMIRRGSWKLITYGHTFDWFNASAFTDQLFNVDEDPFELSDVAAANPGVVSELFGQLEAELGGTGAVAAIDRFEMRENWKLFSTWFAAGRSDAEVAALLSKSFRGNTPAQVSSQYAAWKAAASAL